MKKIVLFLVLVLAASVAYAESQDNIGILEDKEALARWIYHYYDHKDVASVVPAIKSMVKNELLGSPSSPESSSFLSGFLMSVFSQNPDKVEGWVLELDNLKFPGPKALLWSGVWISGIPGWKDILKKIRENRSEQERNFIDEILGTAPPDILTLEIDSTGIIDALWGVYFASGDQRCIQKIISALELYRAQTFDKAEIGEVARRYLLVYAGQYLPVLDISKAELKSLKDEKIKKVLTEIIQLAEEDLKKAGTDSYATGVLKSGQ